jgi:hypothetical protein
LRASAGSTLVNRPCISEPYIQRCTCLKLDERDSPFNLWAKCWDCKVLAYQGYSCLCPLRDEQVSSGANRVSSMDHGCGTRLRMVAAHLGLIGHMLPESMPVIASNQSLPFVQSRVDFGPSSRGSPTKGGRCANLRIPALLHYGILTPASQCHNSSDEVSKVTT